MDAITPQARSQILAVYTKFRAIGLDFSTRVVKTLDKEAIDEAAESLGMLQRGTIYFDTEDTVCVLMDYALQHVRRQGLNAIERYLADSPPSADSDAMAWLQSRQKARYGLIEAKGVDPGLGIEANDVLRRETFFLVDIGSSETVREGDVMAMHFSPLGDFWASTGAGLPTTPSLFRRLLRQIESRFGKGAERLRKLSPEQEADMAALVIRGCLAHGMAQRVAYANPTPARNR